MIVLTDYLPNFRIRVCIDYGAFGLLRMRMLHEHNTLVIRDIPRAVYCAWKLWMIDVRTVKDCCCYIGVTHCVIYPRKI